MNEKLAKAELKVREAYQKYVNASRDCAKIKNELIEEFLKLFINDIEKLPIIDNKHDIIIIYKMDNKLKEVLMEWFGSLYIEDYVKSLDMSISTDIENIKVFYHNNEK